MDQDQDHDQELGPLARSGLLRPFGPPRRHQPGGYGWLIVVGLVLALVVPRLTKPDEGFADGRSASGTVVAFERFEDVCRVTVSYRAGGKPYVAALDDLTRRQCSHPIGSTVRVSYRTDAPGKGTPILGGRLGSPVLARVGWLLVAAGFAAVAWFFVRFVLAERRRRLGPRPSPAPTDPESADPRPDTETETETGTDRPSTRRSPRRTPRPR